MKMKLCFTTIFLLLTTSVSSQFNSQTDSIALVALYNATDGPNWYSPWNLNLEMKYWGGVTLDSNGRVVELKLDYNQLDGHLPPEIGNLSELQLLSLIEAKLSSLPSEIGNLTNLEHLFVRANGPIPTTIGNLTDLTYLNLGTSSSWNIPSEIGNLTNLIYLSIRGSSGGLFPPELGNLVNLIELDLLVDLKGNIPNTIGNLTNLERLHIGSTAPERFFGLTNQLNGALPSEIGNLKKLTYLRLSENKLTSIPPQIGDLSELKYLYLDGNQLNTIPSEIGNLTELEELYLNDNQISGNIPAEFGGLIHLKELHLSSNRFSGAIPSTFGNLTKLERLYLVDNQLTGVPLELENLNNLNFLWAQNNQLTGYFPPLASNNHVSIALNNNNFVFEDVEDVYLSKKDNPLVEVIYAPISLSPQGEIGPSDNINLQIGETLTISVTETRSENNTYEWKRYNGEMPDGVDITKPTLTIPNADASHSDIYYCAIKNTIIPDLVIVTNNRQVLVSGSNDSDNDGVIDSNDNCPNTPSGESVDANGCSDSQKDDDKDGVTNNADNCPNTPSGTSVDANGCPISNDKDNDGVPDDSDDCDDEVGPSTNNGCNLVTDAIKVTVQNEGCKGSNGAITLGNETNIDLSYILTHEGSGNHIEGLLVKNQTGHTVGGLVSGRYHLVFSLEKWERQYHINVGEGEASGLKTRSQSTDKLRAIEVELEGTPPFVVTFNEEQFSTYEKWFRLQGNPGKNTLSVRSSLSCTDATEVIFFGNKLSIYPNPTNGYITLDDSLGNGSSYVLYNINGQVVQEGQTGQNLEISDLPPGTYILTIGSKGDNMLTTKIVKL